MSATHELPAGQSPVATQRAVAGGGPTPKQTIERPTSKVPASAQDPTPADQEPGATHYGTVSGKPRPPAEVTPGSASTVAPPRLADPQTPEQAILAPITTLRASAQDPTPADQPKRDNQSSCVSGTQRPPAEVTPASSSTVLAPRLADPNSPAQTNEPTSTMIVASAQDSTPADQSTGDNPGCAVSGTQRPSAEVMATPRLIAAAPRLADPLLAFYASVLDDLEKVRVANGNRLRMMTRDVTDSDGELRGMGLPPESPEVRAFAVTVEGLQALEHQAELNLKRAMRKHALGPWVASMRGVGEKQAARLLAVLGDPYWNDLHGRPRKVSELWSYCGYGDSRAQVRRRGEVSRWSAEAKMRVHLVAKSCLKQLVKPCYGIYGDKDEYLSAVHVEGCQCSRYRLVYDQSREKYADSVHPWECKRCGPAGKPAETGSPRSDGHQHAMALRKVSKEILKDLWREAKRLHEETR